MDLRRLRHDLVECRAMKPSSSRPHRPVDSRAWRDDSGADDPRLASGVSKTRSRPNSACSWSVTRKTPPSAPRLHPQHDAVIQAGILGRIDLRLARGERGVARPSSLSRGCRGTRSARSSPLPGSRYGSRVDLILEDRLGLQAHLWCWDIGAHQRAANSLAVASSGGESVDREGPRVRRRTPAADRSDHAPSTGRPPSGVAVQVRSRRIIVNAAPPYYDKSPLR
jgi:hypothetical protein